MSFLRVLLVVLCFGSAAFAQDAGNWTPAGTVRVLIGSGPGSAQDVAFAPVDKALTALNIAHMTERVPGADGVIAANRFKARAEPDGLHLMVYGLGQYGTAELVHKDAMSYSYDSFQPVSLIAKTPLAIIARPGTSPGMNELVARLKQQPLYVGSSSALIHVVWRLLAKEAGVPVSRLALVEYRAPPPQLIDVLGGRLDYGMVPLSAALALYPQKQLQIVALTSLRRIAELPDVPTVSEFFGGFEVMLDQGIVVPKGTPADAVRFYAELIRKSVTTPEAQRYLRANALFVDNAELGPERYRTHIELMRRKLLQGFD